MPVPCFRVAVATARWQCPNQLRPSRFTVTGVRLQFGAAVRREAFTTLCRPAEFDHVQLAFSCRLHVRSPPGHQHWQG